MTGITMPGGDPGLLEQLAARLEATAEGTANLAASTRQVTVSIRSEAAWTGDAADAYTAFTGDLAKGVAAAPRQLSKIALAVRNYAGYLRTAQEKVAAYTSAAAVAEVSGNDRGYVSAAEVAAQNANAAVAEWQAAGDRAAADVSAAADQLGDVFGSQNPVASWLARQPADWDALAGFPGSQILKTPGMEFGPEILKTPAVELGPEILITVPGAVGPEILITRPGGVGPEILKTPPGLLGPLVNYSAGGNEKVSDVLKGKVGSITRAPLPRGSPSWSEVGNMTMNEVRTAARANQPGFRTILKLLTDSRFNKK